MAPKIYGDRWQIVNQIGEGGQSHVFLVKDLSEKLPGELVLKRLKNIKRIKRFEQEIRVCQSLQHPSIAPVLDYSLDTHPYFVTQKYPGPALTDLAPVECLEAFRIFIMLCETVAYAHKRKVIHRDLKPDNIVLDSERSPVILDFGLCYLKDDENRFTTTMEQVGSRFYMAPELESGRSDYIYDSVDSYALGKILYFLLTSRHMVRENYSGEDSLTSICNDIQLDYITQNILAKSVIESPRERLLPEALVSEARRIVRLITEHFYPGWEGTICRFCGDGIYKQIPKMTLRVTQPGIEHSVKFSPLVCSKCGNIQWFTEQKS